MVVERLQKKLEVIAVKVMKICYNIVMKLLRASTGFDGGLEVKEAIRGAGPRNNPYKIINADENLAYAA